MQLRPVLDTLGITPEILARKALPFHPVATELVVAETDRRGRQFLLIPAAALAWRKMKLAAQSDGIEIEIVSSFRDIAHQVGIIRNKLARGLDIEHILTLSAPPGYSEHHSGRAIDINTPGCDPTEACFADTEAFRWLCARADHFGFTMSYPPGNALGFIYEPWHWYFQRDA